jgi:ferredoxin
VRIETDTERCVGAGQCVLTAPELFDQDDTGIVTVLREPDADGPGAAAAREAVAVCPSAAITLRGE